MGTYSPSWLTNASPTDSPPLKRSLSYQIFQQPHLYYQSILLSGNFLPSSSSPVSSLSFHAHTRCSSNLKRRSFNSLMEGSAKSSSFRTDGEGAMPRRKSEASSGGDVSSRLHFLENVEASSFRGSGNSLPPLQRTVDREEIWRLKKELAQNEHLRQLRQLGYKEEGGGEHTAIDLGGSEAKQYAARVLGGGEKRWGEHAAIELGGNQSTKRTPLEQHKTLSTQRTAHQEYSVEEPWEQFINSSETQGKETLSGRVEASPSLFPPPRESWRSMRREDEGKSLKNFHSPQFFEGKGGLEVSGDSTSNSLLEDVISGKNPPRRGRSLSTHMTRGGLIEENEAGRVGLTSQETKSSSLEVFSSDEGSSRRSSSIAIGGVRRRGDLGLSLGTSKGAGKRTLSHDAVSRRLRRDIQDDISIDHVGDERKQLLDIGSELKHLEEMKESFRARIEEQHKLQLALTSSLFQRLTFKPKIVKRRSILRISDIERVKAAQILDGKVPVPTPIIDKFNIPISRENLQCLKEYGWMNDEVINFYMGMLQERNEKFLKEQGKKVPQCFIFNTFFFDKLTNGDQRFTSYNYDAVKRWTTRKKVKIFEKDLILVPFNLGKTHWTLGLLDMRHGRRRISFYDSLNGSCKSWFLTMRRYLIDEYADKTGKTLVDINSWEYPPDFGSESGMPQQTNAYDCGVFMCLAADFITEDCKLEFSPRDIPDARLKMVLEIAKGSISE